jgi:AcrR family transcriptional regulator
MARPSARERLLDCAERLFAEHGLRGVSLRAINAEAGLSAAALHYHFGTRQTLVEALLERRMDELMLRRREILDALEAGAGHPTPRNVMDALLRPMVELLAQEDEAGRRYVRLLARLQSDGDLDEAFVMARYRDGIDRVEPLLQRALPEHPVSLVRLRLLLCIELFMRALADWPALAATWRDDEPALSLDAFVASLTDFLCGGLEAPVGEARPRTATAPRAQEQRT